MLLDFSVYFKHHNFGIAFSRCVPLILYLYLEQLNAQDEYLLDLEYHIVSNSPTFQTKRVGASHILRQIHNTAPIRQIQFLPQDCIHGEILIVEPL